MRRTATSGRRQGAVSFRALTSAVRCALFILALAAIACRAVIPAGWMPASDGHRVTVALCTGFGAKTITLSLPGKPDHSSDHGTHPPCIFSGLGAPALDAGNAIASFGRLPLAAFLPALVSSPAHVRIAGRFLPPSQGPPALPV